jgi:hypothetical protein
MLSEWLGISGPFVIPVVAILGFSVVGIVSSLGKVWIKNQILALKRDMVARGFSADDIERVLKSRTLPRNDCSVD